MEEAMKVLNKAMTKAKAKKEEKDKTLAKTRDNTQLVVFAIFFLLYGIYLLRRMKKS